MQRIIMILAVVLAIPCFGGNLDKKLPAMEGLVKWGCVVNGPIWQTDYGDPSGKRIKVYQVDFHATHQDPFTGKETKDWKLFYGYRKKRIKGLIDCDKFMERVTRARLRRTK